MNKDAAEQADSSDWFDCNVTSVIMDESNEVESPFDTSCLAASLQGAEAACKATTDQDGQACDWCIMPGGHSNICLTSDQAAIAAQSGADCGSGLVKSTMEDPYDPSCLVASL